MSQTLQSVLCITTNKYLVHVLVVLLHARFSVVGPIPFLLAATFFFGSSLYRKYYRTSRLLLLLLLLLLFFVRCNSQTTQATELTQTRLQIAPSILITFHIKKDTRHVRLEFQGTATVSYSRNSTNDSKVWAGFTVAVLEFLLPSTPSFLTARSLSAVLCVQFNRDHERPRPVLVKFLRSADVSSILSKRGSLTRPYSIKPDMSQLERSRESALMQERWSLIQGGIDRKCIKIRNTCIYVNGALHGKLDSVNTFHLSSPKVSNSTASTVSNQSVDSSPATVVPESSD